MSAEKSENSRGASKRANAISIGEGQSVPRSGKDTRDDISKDPSTPDKGKERVGVQPRSISAGDIPEPLQKRYFSSTGNWSGEPAYFTTAQAKEPAFRDQGRRLITSSESEEVVRDLVAIARHRSWSNIHVTGSETFRRAAWLEASRQGLGVRGYRPNERDLQELDRLRRDASRNSIAPATVPSVAQKSGQDEPHARERSARSRRAAGDRNERAAQSQLRIIEAVVRTALFDDPAAISRVMNVATTKLQSHIEQGHQIRPAMVMEPRERKPAEVASTRQRPAKVHLPIQRSRGR
ncbi:LPD7 domain-containing protein [Rhizorhabdus wittichii]|uniref:LPD7 domain-containing protein n=1 Tax=Rhizorhabdus wittichii TaxID=160791 RepID=UPI00037D88C4|nr:LPD7 domain-containing protein [Rhizorhabdus wittichii]